MDQGVIRSLKAKFRAKVIRKYNNAMESNKELPKITILDAMPMLEQSCSALPDTTVINCFKKTGISKESQQDFKRKSTGFNPGHWWSICATLRSVRRIEGLDLDLAPDNLTAKTFIDTDEELATSIQSLPSDEKLLHEFTIENTSNEDVEMIGKESDETESTEKEQPSKKALFEAMDLIESSTLDWEFY